MTDDIPPPSPAIGMVRPLDATRRPARGAAPPGWATAPLSAHLESAYTNQWATFAHKGDAVGRLTAIDVMFARVSKDWANPGDLLAAMLMLRCHAAFRAACALVMSGHIAEVSSLHRLALEYAGYGLHINGNPVLGPIWLKRHDDEASMNLVKQKFTVSQVKQTVRARSPHTADRFDALYERAIDFGSHPNERGVTGSMEIEQDDGRKLLKANFLHGDGPALDHALRTTAQVGMTCLEIFECVFGPRFQLLGISSDMLTARKGL